MLRVVRQLQKSRGRVADRLAQPCEHACQLFGLAAAARAQLRANDRGGPGNSEIGLGKRWGKPHLEAPAGRITGQIRRWTVAAAVDGWPRYIWWYRPCFRAFGC